MELRTLRYFVETADTGTVSAAADAVHVTQPALSRQLRQLERELGTNLFDRVGGRLLLSPGGARAAAARAGCTHPRRTSGRRGRDPVAGAAGAPDARRPGDHAGRCRLALHRDPRRG